jgi:hypothetical protein
MPHNSNLKSPLALNSHNIIYMLSKPPIHVSSKISSYHIDVICNLRRSLLAAAVLAATFMLQGKHHIFPVAVADDVSPLVSPHHACNS